MHKLERLLLGSLLVASTAMTANAASLAQQVRGTSWHLVSLTITTPDGKTVQPIGPNPMGYTMFDRTGHFITETLKPGAPNFASGSPVSGTDEEYRAAGQANIVDFGTYTADGKDHTLVMHVIGASFPNWIGTDIHNVTEINGDEMTWHNQAGARNVPVTLVWKRLSKNE
jgi:hypothetical protein